MENKNRFLSLIRHPLFLHVIMACLVFAYILTRAIVLPVSVDEYLSLTYFVDKDMISILTSWNEDIHRASNNHVLNSIFMKIAISIFGEHDWAIRLHSVLALLVAYFYTLLFLNNVVKKKAIVFVFMCVMFLNPFLLDFFSIARGYGLCIAAYAASLYYMNRYVKTCESKDLCLLLAWNFIGFYSNFSFAYYIIVYAFIFIGVLRRLNNHVVVKKHIAIAVIFCFFIFLLTCIPFYRTLTSETTYGGEDSFFSDTVVSMVERYLHYDDTFGRSAILFLDFKKKTVYTFLVVFVWSLLCIWNFRKTRFKDLKIEYLVLLAQCLGVVAISNLLFYVLGTPLPVNRTALIFTPPFILSFLIGIDNIFSGKKGYILMYGSLFLFSLFHFYKCMNFDNTYEWQKEGDAKRVLSYVTSHFKNIGDVPTIGVENWRYPSMEFYERNLYKNRVNVEWFDFKSGKLANFDFCYIPVEYSHLLEHDYELIAKFKHGLLYKYKN